MDLETAQTATTAKLPILKQENGNSFKPVAQTTTNANGTSTSLIPGLVTTKEKVQKKNDVKARSMLPMALPNEHLITFNHAPSAESLNSIFNRLQKINMALVSSPSSTNEVNTAYGVSTANLSDDTVYAFLASQPNGSQLVYKDLEQIHEDDIEEMDLKWHLALLIMRTRRFFQKTGRNITINRSYTVGYDKSKVKCFNCHKMRHFARECKGPRNQDSRNRNQDSSRRTVNVEETSSKAMVAIDGAGFDWSYMADEEVPTNMALMAFSDSEFNKSKFNLATYKRGLAFVEEQLVFYKKNEVIFYEQLAVLKRDISYKDSEISMLKSELEKLKQEKESNQLKIEIFDNASKSLDKLIGSQIPEKSRKEEFQQPKFEGYEPKSNKSVSEDISNEVRKSPDALLVEELVSDDKLEKKTIFPTVAKMEFVRPKQQKIPVRKPVKYAEMYSFDHVKADCNYHQRERVVSGNNYTRVDYNYSAKKAHPSAHRNMVQRAVLMKTGLRSLNTDRHVNIAHPKTIVYSARPMSHISKSAQSTVKRPYQIRTTLTNKIFSQKVNTAKGKFYTARPKAVNTARPNSAVVNTVRENKVNAVKSSTCWVWRPTILNSASITLKRHNYGHPQKEYQGYVDSGYLRNMTGNMSYLSDFKEFDEGYNPTIYVSLIEKFWQTANVKIVDNGEQEITTTVDGKEFTITEASVRRHLQLADVDGISTSEPIPNVPNEAVYEEWDDRVERATTTAASLDVEQASGNITKTQSTTMLNVHLPQGIGSGGSHRCQEAMRGSIAQTRIDGFMYNIVEESEELGGRLEGLTISTGRGIEEINQDAGVTLVTPTHSQDDQPEDQLGVFSAAKVLVDDAVKRKMCSALHTRRMEVAVSYCQCGIVTCYVGLFSTAKESVSAAGASMPVSTAGASLPVSTAAVDELWPRVRANEMLPGVSNDVVMEKIRGRVRREKQGRVFTKLGLFQDLGGKRGWKRL
ncbi:ribonuclease H-like domain-containing protein [Tanacetum coccineum]